jgi:hypothetical protein
MTLKEFQQRLHELSAKGFVLSHRKGPTGIGKTLEDELGITENNIALSDLPFAELKAHREDSKNMITLFTFNKQVWRMDQLEAIRKYGTPDTKGRLGIYFTMGVNTNKAGLSIKFNPEFIDLVHSDGTLLASWKIDDLVERFNEKFPALILVSAKTKYVERGRELFHFHKAQLLSEVIKEKLKDQFADGNILLDLRLHDKGTSARNHGTGFRAYERSLPQIFTKSIDL